VSVPQPRVLVVDRTGELAARIRHNAVGPRALVKACPDTARAGHQLATGHWDVVVAGPSLMDHGGLRRLASLHQRHPRVSVVLALHERPRADLAEIVRVGACDLVPLHTDDADLRETLARAARLTRARLGLAAHPGAGRGRVVMVASASGGCGKTFVATNAATFLARATGGPVVLLDLDLQFGEVSTALRLRPEVTITDALAAEATGADLNDILDEYLLPHPDGFKVLAAPRRPAEADSVTAGDVTRLLDVLRARRAWVVVDSHEGLSDVSAAALEATDHAFVVATPDRPSLLNLGRFLTALERAGMAADSVSVVLNKAESGTGFEPQDMAAELGRGFDAVVPYSRDVLRSINVGVPVIAGRPKSTIARRLARALSAVLPGTPKAGPAGPAPAPVVAIAVATPVAVAAPSPDPSPAVVEPPAAEAPLPDDGPVEIDLSSPRPCRAAGPARRTGRCRRSPERPLGAPLGRGRAPPLSRFRPTRPGH
jgi:pilus assembly protein CpaE